MLDLPSSLFLGTRLPRGAGRSIHSSKSLTASRSLAGSVSRGGKGQAMTGQLQAAEGQLLGDQETTILYVQMRSIQLQVHPSSSSPLLENQPEQSKQQGSMHGAIAGFYPQSLVCLVLLWPKVVCHTTPFKQHECCSSEIISVVLEAASRMGKSPSEEHITDRQRDEHLCPSEGTREGCPAPHGRSVPGGGGGMWSLLRKCWQCLQSQTRQRSYSQRSECKTGLVTSQI